MLNATVLVSIAVYFSMTGIRTIFAESLTALDANAVMCLKTTRPLTNICPIKRRRYDVSNFGTGYPYFHGWVDVQGLGYSNDFCRIVGIPPNLWLSCALAGTHGKSDTNYNSGKSNFDVGWPNTWYMKDEDNDGRDDYCRCVGDERTGYRVTCIKAGISGFSESIEEGGRTNSFDSPIRSSRNCPDKTVRPEFGVEHITPRYG